MRKRRPVIRHIAASYDGSVVAVAEFERHVQTWDVVHRRRTAAFETTFEFGGSRLAISHSGKHCVAGAWRQHGIALYDVVSGAELWRRRDLQQVQTIHISKNDQHVLCGFEAGIVERLDLATGRSIESRRGVHDVWESPHDSVVVFVTRERDYQLANAACDLITSLPRTTFAALDFAFGLKKLCISEATGSVRCFDVGNGEQLWEHDPGQGVHAVNLGYNEFADEFAAITRTYQKGGEHQLKTFDPATGRVSATYPIRDALKFAFCCKGSLLLSSDGKLRETATGDVCDALDFFPTGTGSG
jgi:outer membrane protein assembly factor BamB